MKSFVYLIQSARHMPYPDIPHSPDSDVFLDLGATPDWPGAIHLARAAAGTKAATGCCGKRAGKATGRETTIFTIFSG
jgi:hypothetical protein